LFIAAIIAAMLPNIKADTIAPIIIIIAARTVYEVVYGDNSLPVIVKIE
jgi:hypothetical protein